MSDYYKLHFNAGDLDAEIPGAPGLQITETLRSMVGEKGARRRADTRPAALAKEIGTATTEHAARYYVEQLLKAQGSEKLLAVTDPDSPALVPNLSLLQAEAAPLTNSNVVTFEQTLDSIPVFGSKAVVELDPDENRLLSFDASLAAPPDVSPVAEISAQQALVAVAEYCGSDQSKGLIEGAPRLVYYEDETGSTWHLAYHLKAVPLPPPPEDDVQLPPGFSARGFASCGHGSSPRESSPNYDYLVDAHDGRVLFWFSSAPRLDVPVPCEGQDDTGANRQFFGLNLGSAFALHDPQRNIATYDLALNELDPINVPAQPLANPAADFQGTNPPAISAHFNATVVFDFFNDLLKRKGIDNKGMLLRSVVNAVENAGDQEWPNAAWWRGHMWYGRVADGNGGFASYSRYLDVIGHELAHGVTETTAGLVYAHLPGALNESFSDIFGVLINNWDPVTGFRPLAGWTWEIGSGLGQGGGPLRDFSNPAATGQPDHFNEYQRLPNTQAGDWGGVHYYSGIHNLAAHGVMTAVDNTGAGIIPPVEVAILYYLTLTKLTARGDFLDCRRTLLNVAGTYYSYDPTVRSQRLQVIIDAYDAVGIT